MISYAWPAFVEISLGEGAGVFAEVRMVTPGDPGEYLVIVTNDRAQPISFEAEIETGAGEVLGPDRLPLRDGRPLWSVTVPANGTATVRYRVARD